MKETRIYHVERWAKYVCENANWSKLQKELIDSQIQNAMQVKLTKEQVEQIHNP